MTKAPAPQDLFPLLLGLNNEDGVSELVRELDVNGSGYAWHVLGGNENNFGVIENQQASPVAA